MSSPLFAGWDCHAHVFDERPSMHVGHYHPPPRAIEALEGQAADVGIGHIVLVQPSVYGTDNSLLLESLSKTNGRHRGVVVLDQAPSDAAMLEMHARGVRGVRFNQVSPVGNGEAALAVLAPKLREFAWHVQWYTRPEHLTKVAEIHARHGLVCVLDHLAGFTASTALDAERWNALERLSDMGAWIKLSGWYRLDAGAPFDALAEVITRAVNAFPGRCVWGSDWPNTWFFEPGRKEPAPAYSDLLGVMSRAIGPQVAQRIICDDPTRLYA